MMDYWMLSESKADHILMKNCQMKESAWNEVKLLTLDLSKCNLTRAEWNRTPLAGIDFSSCEIAGWRISLYDLKNARVAREQLEDLTGLLGVILVPSPIYDSNDK